ncbi:hypothetical protein ANN_16076 [Periplaneta americana]|uniref:Uncharacterized protein n=1 Tax=Periplaneta americana TaxID=6978 RepID=A0ABQ8SHZ1_PERAM|nr:hypothetical protein ANN_16076 [Periplaneta americana]
MSPGSNTESYPAFAHIGFRENPGKNLNQVTCPDRDSNPGHLVSRPDALTVTPQSITIAVAGVDAGMLHRVLDELDHLLEVCRVTQGGHIEYLFIAVRALPGRTLSTTRCRHPDCSELETLGHVLGQCPKGELLIIARHHRVRHALAISRADIIAINGRLKRALVLDPTIRFERNLNQATEVDIDKSIYEPCLPYLSQSTTSLLNNGKWIGRGGPVPWSPRSPDLTPLVLFLYGQMRDLVYATPIESEDDLVARIFAVAGKINDNPEVDWQRQSCTLTTSIS